MLGVALSKINACSRVRSKLFKRSMVESEMSVRVSAHHSLTVFVRRIIGAGLVALLIFAQGATAVDGCRFEWLPGGHESTFAVTGDRQMETQEFLYATELGTSAQAPGTEFKRTIPDLDAVVAQVARWVAAPRAEMRLALREPLCCGPPAHAAVPEPPALIRLPRRGVRSRTPPCVQRAITALRLSIRWELPHGARRIEREYRNHE